MDILIIRFSSLGDIVLTGAVVESLHRSLPSARLHILTRERYRAVYDGDPRIASITGIESGESPLVIARRIGRKFDTIIDLHDSPRSHLVTLAMGGGTLLRVDKHAIARRYMVLSRNRRWWVMNVLKDYLDTLRPLGVTGWVLPRIIPGPTSLASGNALLSGLGAGTRPIIGLAPGARHATKRWNPSSFAEVAIRLSDRGDVPVFIGDNADMPVIEEIQALLPSPIPSFAGACDLASTIGSIAGLDGLVTNDSGPMHVAGALGIPFAAVFGPTHPLLGFCPGYATGTILHSGEPCSPCSIHGEQPCRMPRQICMDRITPDRVLAALAFHRGLPQA